MFLIEHIKKTNEILDLLLKSLTCFVFIFLCFNFIFNVGYFHQIGINFVSLLEMKDYYEGTAPLAVFTVLSFGCILNIILYSALIKIFIKYIVKLFKCYCTSIYSHFRLYKLLFFEYKKSKFSIKKEILSIKKDLKKIGPIYQNNILLDIWLFIISLFIIIFPFFQIYYSSINLSLLLCILLNITYLIIVLVSLFVQNSFTRNVINIFLVAIIFFLLGNLFFLKDYKYSITEVETVNNVTYISIRPITKGVIVKDKNKIKLIKWENIKTINKVFSGDTYGKQ